MAFGAWKTFVAVSAVASYALTLAFPQRRLFSTLFALLSTELLVYAVYKVILWPKLLSPLRHLPGPKPDSFFMGNFATILREPNGIPMRTWVNTIPNEGMIRYNMILNAERILLTSPKALGEVLVTKNYEFIKPTQIRHGLGRILGVGVLLAEGDEHKIQRKHLMPAFAYRHIKDLYPIFWSKSKELVDAITYEIRTSRTPLNEKASDTAMVEFGPWLSRATLDIIGVAGMGYDFRALQDPDTELNVTYRSIFTPSRQAKILGILGLFIPTQLLRLLPVKRNDDVNAAAQSIRKVSRQLIEEKQAALAAKRQTGKDILSVALESGGFTVENLVDQTMTFLAAGHETTATASQWALVALCENPSIQSRLREEIRANLPALSSPDSPPATAESLASCHYLHAFCNEVLRVYAPVPLTRREAAKDTSILGQFVPKGTDIILSPFAINMSRELWGEDAEVFNPDRWMGPGRANSGGADSNYSLLTFLHGPRSCIGLQFAKAEFACLMAAIVGRFEMELKEPGRKIEIETGITAKPKGSLELKVRVVEGW